MRCALYCPCEQIAFSYIFAMLASNTALQFIAYPTQVLAKSVKMIPVMLMRIVTVNQKYKLRDYLCVLLITFGIAVFVFKPNKNNGQEDSLLGYGLCLVSLFLDGYTGPTQEALRKQYSPSVNQLMFHLNKFAVLIVFVALVLTNQLLPSLDFIARYPEVITKMLVFSCLSAVGQYLILMTLFRFNSLVLTTITTTRKFFTILISVLWFGNQLTDLQWVGVCFVFSGLLYNGYCKYLDKLEKTAAKANSNKAESIDLESKTK